MARKMKIPKAAQIRGIKKALHNRKTPRAFIPGLKKRLKALGGALALSFAMFLFTPEQSLAQTPVTIQPSQQVLAPAGTACVGTPQTFAVNNRNQAYHSATLVFSGAVISASLQIQGVDSAGNAFIISPTVQPSATFGGISAVVNASGYYPKINVLVSCPSAGSPTFTLTYAGSSVPIAVQGGVSFLSLIDQQMFTAAAGSSNQNSSTFETPFGNSSGIIRFSYASSAVSGSSVGVFCSTVTGGVTSQFIFPVANTTSLQSFKVPPSTCPNFGVTYVSGGAAGNISLEYVFDAPGDAVNTTLGSYTHVTGTTATSVKATNGTLLGINLNTSAAGTISVFDLALASCTGTPSTNTVAVLTIAATENARAIPFNVALLNGICIKASVAMDFTVSSQ